MKRPSLESLLRAAALVGLGVSVLLVAEYRQPLPALCEPGGGCDIVRQSRYSQLFGIPLPFLGVLFFGAALVIAMTPTLRRLLLVPLSVVGLLAAVAFVGIQAIALQAFCQLCLIVDAAALAVGVAGLSLRRVPTAPPTRLMATAQVAAAIVVSAGAIIWHSRMAADAAFTTGEMPAVVLQEQTPDQVTVVEFVDFECPACRAQHAEFKSVLSTYEDQVRVVLKNVPLPQHEHAVDAARAFCCAEEGGEAREMAERLFVAERLSPQDCEEIAVSLGLDRDEFRRCLNAKRTEARLRADQDAAETVGIKGLPTFWIGEERFEGVHESTTLRSSIERALRRSRQS